MALLRYNLCAMRRTHCKRAIQQSSVKVQTCAAITTIQFQSSSIADCSHPWPQATSHRLSVSRSAFLPTSPFINLAPGPLPGVSQLELMAPSV